MRALATVLFPLALACSAPPVPGSVPSSGKALLAKAEVAFAKGDGLRGSLALIKVVEEHPESYWSRRAVEVLWERRLDLAAAGFSYPELIGELYEELKDSGIAGHLLFYDALWFARPGAGTEKEALYLLLVLVDHHHASALWDDGVWLAADLLSRLGRAGDETRILEIALMPTSSRGIDALADGFSQKVRYRLARLYVRQGRYREALRQLALVVNLHSGLKLKDDAMWETAHVYAVLGDKEREAKALEYLVEQCPWSRLKDQAVARIRDLSFSEE